MTRVPRMRHSRDDGRSTTIIGMTDQAHGPKDTPPPSRPTEPGWYDDGHGDQRWHDGTNWTERVQGTTAQTKPGFLAGAVSKRTAAIIGGAALVLGLLLGIAASPAPSTEPLTDKIKEESSRADSMEASRDNLSGRVKDLQEESLNQARSIEEREAAVAAREAAVQTTEDAIAANTLPGNGTFIVGKDIQPGTYQSAGGESCYWSRTTLTGDILDNALGAGSSVVTIQPGDGLITTSRCADFTKVG